MSQHWILKKENIKKLWVCSIVLLVSLVLVQLIFPIKGHFEVESWIGFGARLSEKSGLMLDLMIARARNEKPSQDARRNPRVILSLTKPF